jgi:N-acetyl-anhydromuramyl-L-alanine amidase AmpD
MLTIYDIESLNNIKLNVNKRRTKKTQIFLYDTQRRMDDFINKLKYRNNGTYKDVPHFIISKLGHIYQIFDTNHSSVTFGDSKIDNRLIKIAIENLGWLNKNTINGFLFNWIGDPYRAEPCVKVWRNHYYWDKYTDEQMSTIFELSNFLFEKHKINKKIVPSQGFLQNIQNFDGIVCKSNFSDIYTDINPSFNFRLFNNGEQTDIKLRSDKKDVEHIKET